MNNVIERKNMKFLDFAQTPPRGWNSWDCYGASVTEDEVKANADFVAKNLKQYGWNYIIVDIQWSEPTAVTSIYNKFAPLCMDEYSRLIPAENRFPSSANGQGFKPLADYVHSLGLKFGIHIMRGIPKQAVHNQTAIKGTSMKAHELAANNICPWNTDMYGVNPELPEAQLYYDSLMELYTAWDVDFLKVDDIASSKIFDCHKGEIEILRKAIDKTGKEIVLSLSPGPAAVENGAFLQGNANMWRLTDDFWDIWEHLEDMFARCEKWAPFVRKGNWVDCDMLPLGHLAVRSEEVGAGERMTRFTKGEQRMMMSLWTMVQSPLFYGGDFIDCKAEELELLTNEEVMNMHDTLNSSRQLYRVAQKVVWRGESDSSVYYGVFNLSKEKITVDIKELRGENQSFYDMWNKQAAADTLSIPGHDAVLIKVI
ncbi:MAG: glycoside hydrolase family 27 protein [Lachnospiraceae bacterium]